jgi:RHS repeat-associated protein
LRRFIAQVMSRAHLPFQLNIFQRDSMKKLLFFTISLLTLLSNLSAVEPTMEFGRLTINHKWLTVTFGNTYTDPIVVAGPPTRNGGNRSIVRIQNVTPTSFQMRIQEWDYHDQWHMFEDVSFLVTERGRHTMPNGTTLEAGSINLVNEAAKLKAFTAAMPTQPGIFASIVTNNDSSAVTERLKNVTIESFKTKMQEEEANDGIHASETLNFIAMEKATGTIGNYEYVIGSEMINHKSTTIEGIEGFENFFANMQTLNGGNTASVRITGTPEEVLNLYVQEEKSLDNETWHVHEEVAYLAFRPIVDEAVFYTVSVLAGTHGSFDGNTIIRVEQGHNSDQFEALSDAGYHFINWSDGSKENPRVFVDVQEHIEVTANFEQDMQIEIGTVSTNHLWKKVIFNKTFIDPVVIAGPPSYNDPEESLVRIKNLTATGFEIRLQGWDYLDQSHAEETIDYLVVEKGIHILPGGGTLEAATTTISNSSFKTISITNPRETTPVILTSVLTENDASAISLRINNSTLSSFDLALQEEEAADQSHAEETVAYIIVDPGELNLGDYSLKIALQDDLDEQWQALESSGFTHVFATLQSFNDGETATLRRQGSVGLDLQLSVSEEASLDEEKDHALEQLGYLLIKNNNEPPLLEKKTVILTTVDAAAIPTAKQLAENTDIPEWIFNDTAPDIPVVSSHSGKIILSGPLVSDANLVDVKLYSTSSGEVQKTIFSAERTGDEDRFNLQAPFAYRLIDQKVIVDVATAELAPADILTNGINYLSLEAKDKQGQVLKALLETGQLNGNGTSMLLFDNEGPVFEVDGLDDSEGETIILDQSFILSGSLSDLSGVKNIEVFIDDKLILVDNPAVANGLFWLNINDALTSLVPGESYNLKITFTDLVDNISEFDKDFIFIEELNYELNTLKLDNGNLEKNNKGQIQLFSTFLNLELSQILSYKVSDVLLTESEVALLFNSTSEMPVILENIESLNGLIDTSAEGVHSLSLSLIVDAFPNQPGTALKEIKHLVVWENQLGNPQVTSYYPTSKKIFYYKEGDTSVSLSSLTIAYSAPDSEIDPNLVKIELMDGTDLSEKFIISANQATLKNEESIELPNIEDLVSLKITLIDLNNANNSSVTNIVWQAADNQEEPIINLIGTKPIVEYEDNLAEFSGPNLSKVSTIEIVARNSDVVLYSLPVIEAIEGANEDTIKFNLSIPAGYYNFSINGQINKSLTIQSLPFESFDNRVLTLAYKKNFEPYEEGGIVVTSPLVSDALGKAYSTHKLLSVTGYALNVDIRDLTIECGGSSYVASLGVLNNNTSFIASGILLSKGDNSVKLKINKTSVGWERTVTIPVLYENGGPEINCTFDPEDTIAGFNSLYGTLTVNDTIHQQSQYTLSGKVQSTVKITSYKITLDDAVIRDDRFESTLEDDDKLLNFTVKQNARLHFSIPYTSVTEEHLNNLNNKPHLLKIEAYDELGRISVFRKIFRFDRGEKVILDLKYNFTRDTVPAMDATEENFQVLESYVKKIINHDLVNTQINDYDLNAESYDFEYITSNALKLENDKMVKFPPTKMYGNDNLYFDSENYEEFSHLLTGFGLKNTSISLVAHLWRLPLGLRMRENNLYNRGLYTKGALEQILDHQLNESSEVYIKRAVAYPKRSDAKSHCYLSQYSWFEEVDGELEPRLKERWYKVTNNHESEDLIIPTLDFWNSSSNEFVALDPIVFTGHYSIELLEEAEAGIFEESVSYLSYNKYNERTDNFSNSHNPFVGFPMELFVGETKMASYIYNPQESSYPNEWIYMHFDPGSESQRGYSILVDGETSTRVKARQNHNIEITGVLPHVNRRFFTPEPKSTTQVRVKGFRLLEDYQHTNTEATLNTGNFQIMDGSLSFDMSIEKYLLAGIDSQNIEDYSLFLDDQELDITLLRSLSYPRYEYLKIKSRGSIKLKTNLKEHRVTLLGPNNQKYNFLLNGINTYSLNHNEYLDVAIPKKTVKSKEKMYFATLGYGSSHDGLTWFSGDYNEDTTLSVSTDNFSKDFLLKKDSEFGAFNHPVYFVDELYDTNGLVANAEVPSLPVKPGDIINVSDGHYQQEEYGVYGSSFYEGSTRIKELTINEQGSSIEIKYWGVERSVRTQLGYKRNNRVKYFSQYSVSYEKVSDFIAPRYITPLYGEFVSETILIKPSKKGTIPYKTQEGDQTVVYVNDGDTLIIDEKTSLKIKFNIQDQFQEEKESPSKNTLAQNFPVKIPWYNLNAKVLLNSLQLKLSIDLFSFSGSDIHFLPSLSYSSSNTQVNSNEFGWFCNLSESFIKTDNSFEYFSEDGTRYNFPLNESREIVIPEGFDFKIERSIPNTLIVTHTDGLQKIFKDDGSNGKFLLLDIKDRYNNKITFLENQSKMVDENGRIYTYALTDFGSLSRLYEFSDLTAKRYYSCNYSRDDINDLDRNYSTNSKRLTGISSNHGAHIGFNYDTLNRLTEIVTQAESTPQLKITYHGDSGLVQSLTQDGKVQTFSKSGLITTHIDNNSILTSYKFKASATNLCEEIAVDSKVIKYEYDSEHRLTKVTTPEVGVKEIKYWKNSTINVSDKRGFSLPKTVIIKPDTTRGNGGISGNDISNKITDYTYSDKYFQLKTLDASGGTKITYTYSGDDELLSNVIHEKQSGDAIERFQFNDYGQIEEYTDIKGLVTAYEYYPRRELDYINEVTPDETNLLAGYLYKTTISGEGSSYTITTPRDVYGRATAQITERDGALVRKDIMYNERGEVDWVLHPHIINDDNSSRAKESFVYDARGRLKTKTFSNPVNTGSGYSYIDQVTNYRYDSNGRLEEVDSPSRGNSNLVKYHYEAGKSRLKTVQSESGSLTSYGYDAAGRVKVMVSNHNQLNLNALSFSEAALPDEARITNYTYTKNSEVDTVESHLAGGLDSLVKMKRDGFGRAVKVTDIVSGYISQSKFNKQGLPVESVSLSNNSKILSKRSMLYFANSDLKTITDTTTGIVSQHRFDASNGDFSDTTTAPGETETLGSSSTAVNKFGQPETMTVNGISIKSSFDKMNHVTKTAPVGGSNDDSVVYSDSGKVIGVDRPSLYSNVEIRPSGIGAPGVVSDEAGFNNKSQLASDGSTKYSTEADGSSNARTTESHYNISERISLTLRFSGLTPLGYQMTETRYDLAGRVEGTYFHYGLSNVNLENWRRSSGSASIYTKKTYDSLGRLERFRHKDGSVHRYEYYTRSETSGSQKDALKAIYKVDGQTEALLRTYLAYDLFGNATQIREHIAGATNSYTETALIFNGGSTGAGAGMKGFGKLASTSTSITISGQSFSAPGALTRSYDGFSRIKTKTLPSKKTLAYSFVNGSIPSGIKLDGNNLVNYDRSNVYKLTEAKNLIGDISLDITYDAKANGLVEKIKLGSTSIANFSYDKRGLKDYVGQWGKPDSIVAYDPLRRPTSFTGNGIFAGDAFSYDAFENFTNGQAQTIDGDAVTYHIDNAQNQIASIDTSPIGVRTRRGDAVSTVSQSWEAVTYNMDASGGLPYSAESTFGWIESTSELPVDITQLAVENLGDSEDDTLNRSYLPMSWTDGENLEDYKWRIDVPNGTYVVEIGVGGLDDSEPTDYQVTVNNSNAVNGLNYPEGGQYILHSFKRLKQVDQGYIEIANGLDIDNPERAILLNKICWVRIHQVKYNPVLPPAVKNYPFNYDSTRGRLTEDDQFIYEWDDFDRISTVTNKSYDESSSLYPTPEKVNYYYDALGRRIAYRYEGHSDNKEWPDVQLVYDGIHLVEERDLATNQPIRLYHYENTQANCPIYIEQDSDGNGTLDQKLIVLTDDRGTVVGLTDLSGNIVEKIFYNSTGLQKAVDTTAIEEKDATNKYGNKSYRTSVPFGWTGMYKDPFTGRYHTHYRDYDPVTNRWLSEDPAGYMDGLNLYGAYMGVNGRDVLGLAGYFFDGTANHNNATNYWDDNNTNHTTNVWKLFNVYNSGEAFYAPGVGSGYHAEGTKYTKKEHGFKFNAITTEQATGASMEARAKWMQGNLEKQLASGDNIVDLFGFSRGSATAIQFLKSISKEVSNKNPLYKNVKIRFTGLFDTVTSRMSIAQSAFGKANDFVDKTLGGSSNPFDYYKKSFQLPFNLKYTAKPLHLVSLDEQRQEFAVSDLKGADQVAFRGVHSDVGGSYGPSNVFDWHTRDYMYDEAKIAGIKWDKELYSKYPRSGLVGYKYWMKYGKAHLGLGNPIPTENGTWFYNDDEPRQLPSGMLIHPSVDYFNLFSSPYNK